MGSASWGTNSKSHVRLCGKCGATLVSRTNSHQLNRRTAAASGITHQRMARRCGHRNGPSTHVISVDVHDLVMPQGTIRIARRQARTPRSSGEGAEARARLTSIIVLEITAINDVARIDEIDTGCSTVPAAKLLADVEPVGTAELRSGERNGRC